MGYLVFGESSSTGFIGQVRPFPHFKPGLAVIYAMAAEYLGMRSLYLEGGSGTMEPVLEPTIKAVRKAYEGLLIVGGGINNPDHAKVVAKAGADIIVVGNLLQTEGWERTFKEITKAARK